jgi:glucokinase
MTDLKILAIDIGGSKILAGVVNSSGEVLGEKKIVLDKPSQSSLLAEILLLCDLYLNDYETSAISLSIPGLVDAENGIWLEAVFSKVRNFPLGNILEEKYKLPVFLENDANNCALGEKYFGYAKEAEDFIWLTVSNGCGAGIFLNGKLFTGSGGNAGELGHICVTDEDFTCPCGNKGCLEASAAGPGISRRYKALSGEELSAKEIAVRARSGEENAVMVYKKTGEYIGTAIAAAVNVINVPLVIVGGGISMDYDLFSGDLERTVHGKIYLTANKNLQIKRTKLGYHASLIGAAANCLCQLQSVPDSLQEYK